MSSQGSNTSLSSSTSHLQRTASNAVVSPSDSNGSSKRRRLMDGAVVVGGGGVAGGGGGSDETLQPRRSTRRPHVEVQYSEDDKKDGSDNKNDNFTSDETKRERNADDDCTMATTQPASSLSRSNTKSNKSKPTNNNRDETHAPQSKEPPPHWREVWDAITVMRSQRLAPVDTMGCESLGKADAPPKDFRFQTLVSLMLSSMTKDPTTAAAMSNLHQHWSDGLTIANMMAASEDEIDSLICKVGFHRKKAKFMKETAEILHRDYAGDIPTTAEELCTLPGIGPKMAYICMNVAWNKPTGIGVDVHVHRITNRLKWAKNAPTPEHTRKQLQEWLPAEYWGKINKLLVGFGQTVCAARPNCDSCLANQLCPSSSVKKSSVKASQLANT